MQGIKQAIASMALKISIACNAHVVHTEAATEHSLGKGGQVSPQSAKVSMRYMLVAELVRENDMDRFSRRTYLSYTNVNRSPPFPISQPKLHDGITSRSQSLSRTKVIHSNGWLLASPNRAFSIKNSIPTIRFLVDRDVMGQPRQEI